MNAVIPCLVSLIGIAVTLSWYYGPNTIPASPGMQLTTAIGFIASGALLWFVRYTQQPKKIWQKYAAAVSLYTLLVLLAGSLFPRITGYRHGVEKVLLAQGSDLVTRMPSIGTSLGFVIIAIAGLAAIIHEQNAVTSRRTCGVLLVCLGTLATLGYVTATPLLYWHRLVGDSGMAIQTAATFMLIGLALLTSRFRGFYE